MAPTEPTKDPTKGIYRAVDITMHLAGGSYFIERDSVSIARFNTKADRDYFLDLVLKDQKS